MSRISSVTKPERSSERKEVYNSGLLAWLGCHTDAYEQAKWFGDDLAVKADGFLVADPGPAWMLSRLGAGRPPLERARLGVAFVGAVRRGAVIDLMSHWLAADGLARRLGLSDDVRRSLRDSYERWDGKGAIGARGEEIRWPCCWRSRWRVGSHASPSHFRPPLNQPCRTEASYHGRGRSPVCRSHGLGKGRASVGRWLRFQGGLTVRSGP